MHIRIALLFALCESLCHAAPLLSEKDLKKAPLMTSLDKLKDRDGVVNYHWVCGKNAKTSIRASCNESPAEEFDEATGALELLVTTSVGTFDYGLRHAVEAQDCRQMLRKIRKVQKKNLSYCILGDHVGTAPSKSQESPVNSTFFLLKSPLGYVIDMDF